MDPQPENQSSPAKIRDRLFIQQLGYTRSLVTFLIRRQALSDGPPDVLANLAALGSMRYSPAGRTASEEEWRKLYAISHGLASALPLEIATAFSIWRLRTFFGLFPLIFLIMGIAALEATYLQGYAASSSGWYYFIGLAAVLSWTCALGGLGTSAFFGTSLLAQLASATGNDQAKLKEITDYTYLQTRLMIGILFAFVLGLPFGHLSLDTASASLYEDVVWNAELFTTMLHILAPFLLGFSTALVLAILERFIEGIKTTLGVGQPIQQHPAASATVAGAV
jgi:hypothetical protein